MQKKIVETFIFIAFVLVIFFSGFITAVFSMRIPTDNDKVIGAIENITEYSNRVHTVYKYISYSDTNSRENVIDNLNSLLTESREAMNNFEVVRKDYERLKSISNRKLFFMLGGFASYDIGYREKYFNYKSLDFGLSAGIEYKRSSVLASWGVVKNSVRLTYVYRF